MPTKTFTLEEVAKHNNTNDCWLVIDGKVYDVTPFLDDHPGGKKIVVSNSGKDASKVFHSLHSPSVLQKYGDKFLIGYIEGAAPTQEKKESGNSDVDDFGDLIPYGDPSWYQDWNSPYYNDSHRRLRALVRDFVDKEVIPYVYDWDEKKEIPSKVRKRMAELGILQGIAGTGRWPTKFVGNNVIAGIKEEEFDPFHTFIIIDELCRAGSVGFVWGTTGGLTIGLPPVMHFGSKYLQDKVVKDCLMGEKVICLGITEPWAGSDVANLRTSAKKTKDGKFYIVDGVKKWITNGIFSDYITCAVRTGGKGMGGVSLLLIETASPGVKVQQMNCSGAWCSGTTYITFESVKVPVEHLIGKENQGFKYIMYNFNYERWGSILQASRFSRVCLEEATKYALKRKTFGKRLIEHPVIREKIAEMARKVESTHSWLESITYQIKTKSVSEQRALGGQMALLKVQATTTFEFCAREAAQCFGGLAYTRGGIGEKIERLYREVRALAIPAGSEEIMRDLAIRQAIKRAKL